MSGGAALPDGQRNHARMMPLCAAGVLLGWSWDVHLSVMYGGVKERLERCLRSQM